MTVCAETKCKVVETEITLETIRRSFRKARDQMPSDRPGIIFVKIPRFWLDDERFAFAMADLANDYFREAPKIVSIKYYTASVVYEKEWHGDTTAEIIAYQEHSNPNHRFDPFRGKDWRIFPQDPSTAPPPRTSFNGMPPHCKCADYRRWSRTSGDAGRGSGDRGTWLNSKTVRSLVDPYVNAKRLYSACIFQRFPP